MFIKKSLVSFTITGGGVLVSFLNTILLARLFGVETLGVLSILLAYSFIGSSLIKLGVQNLVLREAGGVSWNMNELLCYMGCILMLSTVFFLFIGYFLGGFFEYDKILVVSITIFLIVFNDFSIAILRGFFSPNLAQMLEVIVRPFLMLFLSLLIYIYGFSIDELIFVPAISYGISWIVVVFYISYSYRSKESGPLSLSGFRRFLSQTFSSYLSLGATAIASQSFQNIFILIVDWVTGPLAVGLVRIALQFGTLVNLASVSINSLYSTTMADFYRRKRFDKLLFLQKKSQIFMGSISLGIFMVVFSSSFFVPILFDFGGYEELAWVAITLVSSAYLFQGIGGPCGNILNMVGRQSINFIAFLTGNLVLLLTGFLGQYIDISVFELCGLFSFLLLSVSILQWTKVNQIISKRI